MRDNSIYLIINYRQEEEEKNCIILSSKNTVLENTTQRIEQVLR